MAVSPSGYLLGVCLNGVLARAAEENEDTEGLINGCSNPKFKKILRLLTTINKQSGVFAQFPVDKILDIIILSVDESYRGQGICKALIERTKYVRTSFRWKHIWQGNQNSGVFVFYFWMYRVKSNFLPAYRGHEQPLHVEASNGWQPLVFSNPASNERTENKAQVKDRGYENKKLHFHYR